MTTIETVCEGAKEIPCSPALLPSVVKLLEDPDSQLEDLEKVVSRDPGLSVAVLRLANSASFANAQKFDNLREALLRLGFRETYRLVVSVLGGRWAAFDVDAYDWSPGDFCRHSFTVAVATRRIAIYLQQISPDLAYTAGLMHDVGKLALACVCKEQLADVRQWQRQHNAYWLDAELAVLGFNHCDISKALLTSWNFPDNLIAAASFYDRPQEAPEPNKLLTAYVHLGKHLAIQTGIGDGEDAFWTRLDDAVPGQLGVTERDMQALLPDLMDELNRILGARLVTGHIGF